MATPKCSWGYFGGGFLQEGKKKKQGWGCSRKCSCGDFGKDVGVDLCTCGFQTCGHQQRVGLWTLK